MLTAEEKALKGLARSLSKSRWEELKGFCQRYNDPECQLTDAERALIDEVAFDVAGANAPCIVDCATSRFKKYSHYLKYNSKNVYMSEKHFYKRMRSFFSVLDSRKQRYEYRGNVIIDVFTGNEHETALSIQDHMNNGWNITFQSKNNEMLTTTFHKAEVEEYL